MKKILPFLFIFLAEISFAQKADLASYSGIFLTANDYTGSKLSYEVSCNSSSGKIKLNHFFAKNYIEVIQGGKKIQLSKDSIFGYRDCKQKSYRFFKDRDREFEIAESSALVIYTSEAHVASSSGKSATLVAAWYFSKDISSVIIPLTIDNLKKAFPGNIKLHDLLDVQFNSANDISAYDAIHKMYKINYLLSQLNSN